MCEWGDALLCKGGWMRATVRWCAPRSSSLNRVDDAAPPPACSHGWMQRASNECKKTPKQTNKNRKELGKKKKPQTNWEPMPSVCLGSAAGGALLSRCGSCWLRAFRGARLVSGRGPGRTSRSAWHLRRAFCQHRTPQWSVFCGFFFFGGLFFSP